MKAADNRKNAIEVEGMSHVYGGGVVALRGVSFEVREGEVFGILGPNGGGKTTLFKIMSTLMRANQAIDKDGVIRIGGYDVAKEGDEARGELGVVFQNASLDGKLSAWENLKHQGRLYGMRGKVLEERMREVLGGFGLLERKGEYVERFSGGMKRKVEIAKAVLHRPRVLILDEPSTGLDPAARRELWGMLEKLREEDGVTIVLTTHLMEEAERCDRLAILSQGEIVGMGEPGEMKAMIGGDVVSVEVEKDEDAVVFAGEVREAYEPWKEGTEPGVVNGVVRFEHEDGARMVGKISGKFGGRIRRITVGQPNLEDVFVHLTGAKFENEE